MEAQETINKILPKGNAYKKTKYLLCTYKDLKNGASITSNDRSVLNILDKALELIEKDEDFEIIKKLYIEGMKIEEVADNESIDMKTVYRRRKRLIKRLSIILYGDKAL